ncbi:MAG: hypothetical protein M1839_002580 [Geoglossum umbratile]|nr:MAG: hypothetical protein M1839_002580 [Geoglossum umbratile]
MRESPSTSNPTRHTIASASKTVRRTITEPIAAVVATNELKEIDDALTRTFQQLEINEDELSPRQATPNPEPNTLARPSIMNSNTPAQTFNDENSTLIAVEMYIEDVDKAKLRRLIFYNGLRGVAQQWCSQLDPGIRQDWDLLKEAFNQRFTPQRNDDRNEEYLLVIERAAEEE